MAHITVITDESGRVVGTRLGHGDVADPATGIRVALTAGPGQTVHKIDADVPRLRSRADVERFHTELARTLAR